MPLGQTIIFTTLFLEDYNLLVTARISNHSRHGCFCHTCTNFDVRTFAKQQDVIKGYFLTNLGIELLNAQDIALLHTVLLAASFNYCIHISVLQS